MSCIVVAGKSLQTLIVTAKSCCAEYKMFNLPLTDSAEKESVLSTLLTIIGNRPHGTVSRNRLFSAIGRNRMSCKFSNFVPPRWTLLMLAANNRKILGYGLGEIPTQGAVTADITIINPNVPLQALVDGQYQDSKTMDRRPGMYVKYFLYQTQEETGKILTGGSYLFDTQDNAEAYARWTTEDYKVGTPETPFWEQPMFESTTRIVWKVIGAHNFAPIEEHAIGRLQRWKCHGRTGVEKTLRDVYPALKSAAKSQDAAAIWLLYSPGEEMVGLQLSFLKGDGGDDLDSVKQSVDSVAGKPSLGHALPESLALDSVFDRCSAFLTLWLPGSRAAGGSSRAMPWYPALPSITNEEL